jgi:ceramide glucosyltransferase
MIALGLYLLLLAMKGFGAWLYIRRFPAPSTAASMVPVTVCQAILSGDPALEATLAATVEALPNACFIWLIDSDDPTADDVTTRIRARHAGRPICVLCLPPPADGINPKLVKLEAARAVMSTGILVVLDDDTRLSRSSLAVLVESLERCELATGLPFYRDADTIHGQLLAQFVNNNAALAYLPPLILAPPVSINGMCYALKTETITQINGFAPLLHHLTDDLAVADAVRDAGGRLVQTPYPQEVGTTIRSFAGYVRQMHRWYVFALLLMRRQRPGLNILMLVFYGLPPLLLAFAIAATLRQPTLRFVGLLLATLVLRSVMLRSLQIRLTGAARHRPMLSLASELLQPLHLLHAMLVKSIRWRTRHYRVYDNDRFVSR